MDDNRRNGLPVEAGKLICFSTGEYSDYGYDGHFLTLEPLTRPMVEEVADKCRARCLEEDGYDPKGYFIPELIKRGLIMIVDCQEIHIGSYGELDV